MLKTKDELFTRLEASKFDFYLDDDTILDENVEDDYVFLEAEAVTIRSEWFDEPVEGEELASVDDEQEVRAFLDSLKSEGFRFDIVEKTWENEEGEYSVTALLVVPE